MSSLGLLGSYKNSPGYNRYVTQIRYGRTLEVDCKVKRDNDDNQDTETQTDQNKTSSRTGTVISISKGDPLTPLNFSFAGYKILFPRI